MKSKLSFLMSLRANTTEILMCVYMYVRTYACMYVRIYTYEYIFVEYNIVSESQLHKIE
jgi:hypothetical protein